MDGKEFLAELAKQAQAGNDDAYSSIIKELHPNFLAMAKRIGKASDTLVDDLYNEAIYSLVKSVPAWDQEKGPFISWAMECAKRTMYSHLRRSNKDTNHNIRATGGDIELACVEHDGAKLAYDETNGEFLPCEPIEQEISWDELREISDLACAAVEALHKLDKSQRDMVIRVLNGEKLDDIVQWMIDNGHISQEVPERLQAGHARTRMRRCLEMIADYTRDIAPELSEKISITNPLQQLPSAKNDNPQT
jgi:RNA polymerase sigma factor (sigma-70 family)